MKECPECESTSIEVVTLMRGYGTINPNTFKVVEIPEFGSFSFNEEDIGSVFQCSKCNFEWKNEDNKV